MSQFSPSKTLNSFQFAWSQLDRKSLTYQRAVHCSLWSPSIHLHPSSDLESDTHPARTGSIIPSTDIVERDIRPAKRFHPPTILSLFFVTSILHNIYRPLINSSIIIHILFIILVILFVYVSFINIHKKTHKNLHFCCRLPIGFQKSIPAIRPYRSETSVDPTGLAGPVPTTKSHLVK